MGNGTTDRSETQTLTLRAEIAVLAAEKQWSRLETHVPDELPVERFSAVDTYRSNVSGNLAVAIVSAELSDEKIETVVRKTLAESEHARIALLATEHETLLRCEVPHDDTFVFSDGTDEFATIIKHLYVRAYYCVTADRYYKLSLAIKNHETKPSDSTNSEKVNQLKKSRRRTEAYLEQFQYFLHENDFNDIKTRDHRYANLTDSESTVDPSDFNLPRACPSCGLDWTGWHGPHLRIGYEQIGADTWRCTDCGHITADNDPDNYRIG